MHSLQYFLVIKGIKYENNCLKKEKKEKSDSG